MKQSLFTLACWLCLAAPQAFSEDITDFERVGESAFWVYDPSPTETEIAIKLQAHIGTCDKRYTELILGKNNSGGTPEVSGALNAVVEWQLEGLIADLRDLGPMVWLVCPGGSSDNLAVIRGELDLLGADAFGQGTGISGQVEGVFSLVANEDDGYVGALLWLLAIVPTNDGVKIGGLRSVFQSDGAQDLISNSIPVQDLSLDGSLSIGDEWVELRPDLKARKGSITFTAGGAKLSKGTQYKRGLSE